MRLTPLFPIAALLALAATPAWAQPGEKGDSVGQDAVDAVSQPLSDLNLRSRDIPPVLLQAQAAPYALGAVSDCAAVRREIAALEEVLGPDADAAPEEDGVLNKGLKVGGSLLGGLIPFRGVVRQISGAAAEENRWEAAIYGGVARRSFLKGYGKGLGCLTGDEEALRSAAEVLGMSEMVEE